MQILNQLKDKKRFTSLELDIINYITINFKNVLHMTADELAGATYTSTASIIRLCQKLGLKGYKEFKVQLATEINSFNVTDERIREDIPFKKSDTNKDAISKLLNLNYQALTDTYNNMDIEKIDKVAQMICKYNDLSILGTGSSHLIAADFYSKILRLGMNAHLDSMSGFSHIRSISQESGSLAMFVSYYGRQNDQLRIAQILHNRNIPIILITGPSDGPLCKYADEIIYASVYESYSKVGTFSSRTSMQFILDAIFSLIFISNYDKNVNIIDNRTKDEFLRVNFNLS
ncbi:MurR/RpiR family transcriptional regulator [Clostridium felsineum]|uniref:MurR/RpiR family transcriptional regulator n=1 Tax=Clostridium felsineum TaxID=36839 RepID=UPI00098C51D4|nr:MurR/RpiR family transcriptional regulator [Clostridium felsineum]URZ16425.1 putative HTH-type transcriptional regulator YbbH [Clostridium felsineum DSM 794]